MRLRLYTIFSNLPNEGPGIIPETNCARIVPSTISRAAATLSDLPGIADTCSAGGSSKNAASSGRRHIGRPPRLLGAALAVRTDRRGLQLLRESEVYKIETE
jgi:hypothetical protein